MQKKYSVIVFDLGNVLLPFDYTIMINKLEKIEKNLGYNFVKFYQDNYNNIHKAFERGGLSEKLFIDKMLSCLQQKIDKETFCSFYSKVFRVNENVVSLLPELKKNYMLVLLSNTNSIHRKYGWENYKFLKYFDKLVLSYETKALKPEEKIYKAVEDFTQKPPDEHIFIDDIKEYSEGAKKLGWDSVHFTNYENLIRNFGKRGILI
jgi:glucose-1-phosphatase